MDKDKIVLKTMNYIKYGKKLLGISKVWNILFSVDISSGDTQIISIVPEWKTCNDFSSILYWNKNLVLVPLLADKIWFFSMQERTWSYIALSDSNVDYNGGRFCNGYIKNNKLYLVGNCYPGILKVDLEMQKIEKMIPIYDSVISLRENIHDGFSFWTHAVANNKIYIASGIVNKVHIFDMTNDTYEDMYVGNEKDKYVGMTYDGTHFWLAARSGKDIIKWDGYKGEERVYQDEDSADFMYDGIYSIDKHIIVAGLAGRDTMYINRESMLIQQMKEYYVVKGIIGDSIIGIDLEGKINLQYNDRSIVCLIPEIEISILKSEVNKLVDNGMRRIMSCKVIREGVDMNLTDFIAVVKNQE